MATAWREQLAKCESTRSAGTTYVGRASAEARKVAEHVRGALYFVSAGVGLVRDDTMIPLYDLTIGGGESSIAGALKCMGSTPADWWMANANRGDRTFQLRDLISEGHATLVLLALPNAYVEMVRTDLESLDHQSRDRLRIFTAPNSRSSLPAVLRQFALPYDDRLEATRYAGTRADFPQRALRHFTEELGGHERSLSDSISAVVESLAELRPRIVPTRSRSTDDEIARVLNEHWLHYDGRGSRLLRFLRDEVGIACEQSRFREIWSQIKQERLQSESRNGA
jgi:hypothetical protein